MKKLLVFLMLVLMTVPAFAGKRGALTNVYSTWSSVTGSTTVTLPFNSRDLTIHNGSSIDVVVDLKGNTIDETYTNSGNSIFQIQGDESITFRDFVTDKVSLRSETGVAASPVSVIATY